MSLPENPKNPLEQAMADYHLLEAEVSSLKDQVKSYSDLANKLQAENDALRNQIKEQGDFFTKQIATVTAHRDRLERFAGRLITRFKVIRECFAVAEEDAKHEAIHPEESKTGITPSGAGGPGTVAVLPANTI